MEEKNNSNGLITPEENEAPEKKSSDPNGALSTLIALSIVVVGVIFLFANIRDFNPFDHIADMLSGKASWGPVIVGALISIPCAILAFKRVTDNLFVNVVLKLLGAPVFLLLLLFGAGARRRPQDTSSVSAAEADAVDRAARDFKQAAQNKAGAVMQGHTQSAAQNQRRMDESMADMLTGGRKTAASEAYKRAAAQKAGAEMTGRAEDAARAQAQMDKALADMIRDSKRQ